MTTTTTTKPKAAAKRSLARARPVTAEELGRLRELHGAGLSCRQIAKEMARTPATISKHAAELGLKFDRAQVKEATAARSADLAAIRVLVSGEFLMIAQQINAHVRQLLEGGDPEDLKPWHLRDYAYAAGAYFDRHLAQDVHDKVENSGNSEVDRWLEAMTGKTPPPSRSEADQTAKVTSVLGGMADALFKKYGDEYEPPENI
jgi:hypothetical protein